jgi:hypothetical protein
MPLEINEQGWKELAEVIVDGELTRRAQAIADACNQQAGLTDGYRIGTEGDGPQLTKHDQRITVIAATAEAIVDNAKNNRLVQNFNLAGGQ